MPPTIVPTLVPTLAPSQVPTVLAVTMSAEPATPPMVMATRTPAVRPTQLVSKSPLPPLGAADPRPRTDADDRSGITLPPEAQVGTNRASTRAPKKLG
jgi:hypothetical protein